MVWPDGGVSHGVRDGGWIVFDAEQGCYLRPGRRCQLLSCDTSHYSVAHIPPTPSRLATEYSDYDQHYRTCFGRAHVSTSLKRFVSRIDAQRQHIRRFVTIADATATVLSEVSAASVSHDM
jgi:hypothetical protein